MNPNRMLATCAILVAAAWSNQPAWADEEHYGPHAYSSSHGHHDARAGEHLHHLLNQQKAIGLTEEQVKKLKGIDLDYDRARIKSEAEIRIAERELLGLVEDEKSDMSAIEAKVKQSEMLEADLRVTALKARRAALALLTPEQLENAKAAHEKRRQAMMRGYGHEPDKADYEHDEKGHAR